MTKSTRGEAGSSDDATSVLPRRPPVGLALLAGLALALALAACSTSTRKADGPPAPASSQTLAEAGGEGVACGPNRCPVGQICCNESCGICTPPDGFCTQQLCEPGAGAGASGGGGSPGAGGGRGGATGNPGAGGATSSGPNSGGAPGTGTGGAAAPGAGGAGGAGAASCTRDADCRAFSDYCTGCDCRALRKDAPDPPCSGPGVRCLVDPCRDQQAVCRAGKCALGPR